jgi:hypothetical protein
LKHQLQMLFLPTLTPANVEIIQKSIPLFFRTACWIYTGGNLLIRFPDNLKLSINFDFPNPHRSFQMLSFPVSILIGGCVKSEDKFSIFQEKYLIR